MKTNLLMGGLGLFGFLFIGYFFTLNVNYLSFIGLLAFLSNFIIYRLKKVQTTDYQNYKTEALATIGKVAILQFFVLWCIFMLIKDQLAPLILVQLFFAIDANLFAVILYKKATK